MRAVAIADDRSLQLVEASEPDLQPDEEFTGVISETGTDDNVRDFLGGPPRVVFDCTGHPVGISTAISTAAPAGRIVIVGVPAHPSTVNVAEIAVKEVQIRGSLAYTSAGWRQALDSLAAGEIPAADLITAVAPLEDAEQWFGELTSGTTRQIKVLLKP